MCYKVVIKSKVKLGKMDVSCNECDMAPYLSTPCQILVGDDVIPLLSLDQPADTLNKKFSVPPSTVILSRVCVNYLSSKATFADWSICIHHRKLLLDDWTPGDYCCHHEHEDNPLNKKMGSVTFAMSKTILRSDGMVLPIGGTVCAPCKESYIKRYIPGLTSISDLKAKISVNKTDQQTNNESSNETTEPNKQTLPISPVCTESPTNEASRLILLPERSTVTTTRTDLQNVNQKTKLTPEEIQRKISALQPVKVITSPSSMGVKKFFVLQPRQPISTQQSENTTESLTLKDMEGNKEEFIRKAEEIARKIASGENNNLEILGNHKEQDSVSTRNDLIESNEETQFRTETPNSVDSITIKDETIDKDRSTNVEETLSIRSDVETPPLPGTSASTSGTKKDISDNNNQDEYKFYCKLCHIGFLKETSYKYHFANNIELHRKAKKQKDNIRKCDDCGKKFTNDRQFRKHLYNEHKLDDPFYCKLCNIILKNESAYKSHHSKLHLERRTKIFYCRECEDIFKCKIDHQEHIRNHWDDMGDENGFQCTTCGKVFGSGNKTAYVKHLATHDDDSQKPCSCRKCDGKSIIVNNNVDPEERVRRKKRKPSHRNKSPGQSPKQPKMDVLDSITKTFEESILSQENAVDDPDSVNEDEGIAEVHDEFEPEASNSTDESEDMDTSSQKLNVNCGVCGKTFEDIEFLEKHIEKEHGNESDKTPRIYPFVAREGGWKCNLCKQVLRTSRALKAHKSKKECSVLKEASIDEEVRDPTPIEGPSETSQQPPSITPRVKNNFNALWQQSESRNWAAEFGYGKSGNDEKEKVIEKPAERTKIAKKPLTKPIKPTDILSAMKAKFGANLGDDSTDDEDETYLYGSKNRDGRSQSMANRSPRVLSHASRQTRKRLELLTKQAQALMKQKEKSKIKNQNNSSQETTKSANIPVEVSSDDDDLNADINNEDDLLIPLANGWVCEKRRDATIHGGYITHYWSPEGEHFKTKSDIQTYVTENKLTVDMGAFDAADINVNKTENTEGDKSAPKVTSVRVKDDETGLPMVIIFPGGRDCLTMDVSATA